jgi:cysteinyl-tRNA synthetase
MEAADRGYRRLLGQTLAVRDAPGEPDPEALAPWRKRFYDAVRDDLNAPRALAVAGEVARDSALAAADRRALLEEFDRWLGLDLLVAALPEAPREADPRIDALVAQREEARRRRDFAEADRIRDLLGSVGVSLEDTPEGPRWRRK